MPSTYFTNRKFKADSTRLIRVAEWWEHKFTPIFGTVFATAILLEIPFAELFKPIFFLFVALIPGASYVSLINDLTDIEDDRLAGKENNFAGKSKTLGIVLICICIAFGITVLFFLQQTSFTLYLSAWLVFTLYSVPPFRLKKRGILGVFCDALGASVFPQLFAVAFLVQWFIKEMNFLWIILIGAWSLCFGLRGILWHQLKDRENDLKAGVSTFVQRYKTSTIQTTSKWILLPPEMLALVLILMLSTSYFGFIALTIYFFLEWLRSALWKIDMVIVTSANQHHLLMDEFYGVFYPIVCLACGFNLSPYYFLLAVIYIVIFPHRIWQLFSEIIRLLIQLLSESKKAFKLIKDYINWEI